MFWGGWTYTCVLGFVGGGVGGVVGSVLLCVVRRFVRERGCLGVVVRLRFF